LLEGQLKLSDETSELRAADLNGDGLRDVNHRPSRVRAPGSRAAGVSAQQGRWPLRRGERLAVRRARPEDRVDDGHGHFSDETAARLPDQPNAQSWPHRLLVEDFNDDGKPDLAVQYASVGITRRPTRRRSGSTRTASSGGSAARTKAPHRTSAARSGSSTATAGTRSSRSSGRAWTTPAATTTSLARSFAPPSPPSGCQIGPRRHPDHLASRDGSNHLHGLARDAGRVQCPRRRDDANVLHRSHRKRRPNIPLRRASTERRGHERAQPPRHNRTPLTEAHTHEPTGRDLDVACTSAEMEPSLPQSRPRVSQDRAAGPGNEMETSGCNQKEKREPPEPAETRLLLPFQRLDEAR